MKRLFLVLSLTILLVPAGAAGNGPSAARAFLGALWDVPPEQLPDLFPVERTRFVGGQLVEDEVLLSAESLLEAWQKTTNTHGATPLGGRPDHFVGDVSYVGWTNGSCGSVSGTVAPVRNPVDLWSVGGPPAGKPALRVYVNEAQGQLLWFSNYLFYFQVLSGVAQSNALAPSDLGLWHICIPSGATPGSLTLFYGVGDLWAGSGPY